MPILISIYGIKLTKEGFSLIGLSLVTLSLPRFFFTNIVKALIIFMAFGTAAKTNHLY